MNIGINARHLIKGKLEGIGWYSFEILNRLVLLMPKHKFFFFYDRKTDFLISGDNAQNSNRELPQFEEFVYLKK